MFKHWIEILHEHDNGCLDWLFNQNVFPVRESASIMYGNSKGFKLEELSKGFYNFPLRLIISEFLVE